MFRLVPSLSGVHAATRLDLFWKNDVLINSTMGVCQPLQNEEEKCPPPTPSYSLRISVKQTEPLWKLFI